VTGDNHNSVEIAPDPATPGTFVLTTSMVLPRPPSDVFPYFADARNLETITPPWLHFRIVSDVNAPITDKALIDYRLRIHGWPIRWRTEIIGWNPPHRFIDRQLRGPYRVWHHEHTFEEVELDGAGGGVGSGGRGGASRIGTLARDRVTYSMFCGGLTNRVMVRRDLLNIFRYRQGVLARVFHA
jgi:ligand-binding SRPBCC domain-containing protein